MSKTSTGPDPESPPHTPRWVKMFGIIAIVLVLLIVVIMVISGGSHGPGRHMPSGDAGRYTPSVSIEHILHRPRL